MRKFQLALITLALSLTGGCASGLNSIQEREYSAMESEDVLIKEKDPAVGLVLGILPGGGSFYAREPGWGVANLLLWPASILWDPVSGYEGSKAINYDITMHDLKRKKQKEIADLDDRLTTGEIDNTEYVAEKNKIERKYSFN